MKKIISISVSCLLIVIIGSWSGGVQAAGWEEAWASLSEGKSIKNGVWQSGTAYSMQYTFKIDDGDGNPSNFSRDGDKISLTVTNIYNDETLTLSNATKDELITFAQNNKDSLLIIVFAGSPEASAAGISNAAAVAGLTINQLFGAVGSIRNSDIGFSTQYDYFKVGSERVNVTGSSGMFAYSKDIGEPGGHAIGIEIPYRTAKSDDKLNSEMVFTMFSPKWEYRDKIDENEYIVKVMPSFGVTYMKSDFFPDGGGYLQYGLSLGGAVSTELMERFIGKAGLSYQYLRRYIPNSLVPEELQWLADAFNDASADQTLTPALGLTMQIIPDRMDLNFSIAHTRQLGGDAFDEYKSQTIVNSHANLILLEKFRLQLGYQTSFGIKDYRDHSIIASIRYLW